MNSGHQRLCALDGLIEQARGELEAQARDERRHELDRLVARSRQNPLDSYAALKRHPRYVVWELTLACNLRCGHCGSSAGRARDDELSLGEMLQLCDDLAQLECERLTLLGGEPLVHPHWADVARRIRSNGFRANVITNGWTLHRPQLCDLIQEVGLTIVGVSLDGMGPSHDRLRRRPGSFARVAEGIKLLRERDVPVAVSTVVTSDSLSELSEMHAYLTEEQVKVWQLQIVAPLGRMGLSDPSLVPPDRLPELFEFVTKAFAATSGPRLDLSDNVGYYGSAFERWVGKHRPQHNRIWGGCYAGIQALGIDSNGDIKGCQSLPSRAPFIEGNVRNGSLRDIWCDPEAFAYTRKFDGSQLRGYCADCQYGLLCKAGCTSQAVAFTGQPGDNPMCLHRYECGGASPSS
jgi:radical SAM protein with 4Fe4S-binding SPASM domain